MRYYSSIATAKTLSTTINASATQITLNALPEGLTSYPYTLVLDPDTISEEIVSVTSLASGTTLNVTRGQDGSTATGHNTGAVVKHMVTARDLQEPQTHIDATTSVHGISNTANLATKAGAETLTNKTIAFGSNTVSGTKAQFNTAVTDGDIAFLDGATFTGAVNVVSPTATGSTGVRQVTMSTADPTGGSDGDVWLKYV